MGQALVAKRRGESALAAYLANPNDATAFNELAAIDPDRAMGYARLRSAQEETAAKAAERQRRQALGQRAAGGDYEGAANEAAAQGDFDLAKEFRGWDKDTRERGVAMYKGAAPVAYQAMKLPLGQRKAFLEQNKPMLKAVGWTDEVLDQFEPTDSNLGAVMTTAQTLQQLQEQDKVDYRVIPEGARMEPFSPTTGRPLAAGGGAPAPVAAPAPASAPPGDGLFRYSGVPEGTRTTSDYRSPQRNRDVGGVPNSYHTRRDAAGNAMARDFVPPPGMSMAQLHSALTQANPHLDVINEGDHVHIEPRGDGPAQMNAPRGTRPAGGAPDIEPVREAAQRAIANGADPRAVAERFQQVTGAAL
jgi:hypothetical protein